MVTAAGVPNWSLGPHPSGEAHTSLVQRPYEDHRKGCCVRDAHRRRPCTNQAQDPLQGVASSRAAAPDVDGRPAALDQKCLSEAIERGGDDLRRDEQRRRLKQHLLRAETVATTSHEQKGFLQSRSFLAEQETKKKSSKVTEETLYTWQSTRFAVLRMVGRGRAAGR